MIDFQNLTQIQIQSLMGEEEVENKDMTKLLSTLTEGLDDNDIQKKQKQQRNIITQK